MKMETGKRTKGAQRGEVRSEAYSIGQKNESRHRELVCLFALPNRAGGNAAETETRSGWLRRGCH